MSAQKSTMTSFGVTFASMILGLVAAYNAIEAEQPSSAPKASHQLDEDIDQAAALMNQFIECLTEITEKFSQLSHRLLSLKGFPAHLHTKTQKSIEELVTLIAQARLMEQQLKIIAPPLVLKEKHLELRRAMAQAREEIVLAERYTKQLLHVQAPFESEIDLQGLQALAEHSDAAIKALVNA